jgi:hypothetical protein
MALCAGRGLPSAVPLEGRMIARAAGHARRQPIRWRLRMGLRAQLHSLDA